MTPKKLGAKNKPEKNFSFRSIFVLRLGLFTLTFFSVISSAVFAFDNFNFFSKTSFLCYSLLF